MPDDAERFQSRPAPDEGDTVVPSPGIPVGPYADLGSPRLDRFAIAEGLGEGGMGTVFRARDLRLGRDVAIKRLRAESDANRRALEQEARLVASLEHPNIVRIYDVIEDGHGLAIVMELLEAGSLQQRIDAEGAVPIPELMRLAVQLCDALDAAHSVGIVHRDIKPGNVLLTRGGTPKLADFGLASSRSDAGQHGPVGGSIQGTPYYAAPEQSVPGGALDARADIYSLGALLYAASTGLRPRVIKFEQVPIPLRSIVERCLEEEPGDRYASVSELRQALEKNAPNAAPRRHGDTLQVEGTAEASLGFPWELERLVQASLADGVITRSEFELLARRAVGCGFDRDEFEMLLAARAHSAGCRLEYLDAISQAPSSDAAVPNSRYGRDESIPERTIRLADGIDLRLVTVPAGQFTIGGSGGERFEGEVDRGTTRVAIGEGLEVGVVPVTQRQWRAVMGAVPVRFAGEPEMPVAGITWEQAREFCRLLSVRCGVRVRLPSESEWEYFCRAGSVTRCYFGQQSSEIERHAWCAENAVGQIRPVGRLLPNRWGLHDLYGNVWEWCEDVYLDTLEGICEFGLPRAGSLGDATRVVRGGSIESNGIGLHSAMRMTFGDGRAQQEPVGFRVVAEAKGRRRPDASVHAWLLRQQLGELWPLFATNGVSVRKLVHFEEVDLIELGVASATQRHKILQSIERFWARQERRASGGGGSGRRSSEIASLPEVRSEEGRTPEQESVHSSPPLKSTALERGQLAQERYEAAISRFGQFMERAKLLFEAEPRIFDGESSDQNRVRNRVESCKPGSPIGQILLCYDDTLFKSGKDGLLLTTEGVHVKNSGEPAWFLPWSQIESARSGRLGLLASGLLLEPGSKKVEMHFLNEVQRAAFAEFIEIWCEIAAASETSKGT